MSTTELPTVAAPVGEVDDAIASAQKACGRVAPLWPLGHFVAANPFLGVTDLPFIEACDLFRRLVPGGMQMGSEYYRELATTGAIADADLEAALALARRCLPAAWCRALAGCDAERCRRALREAPAAHPEALTVAEAVDRVHGTAWAENVVEAVAHFCAAYHDRGQAWWHLPWQTLDIYSAWRQAAMLDAKPEYLGLRAFRRWAATLPTEPAEAIRRALATLDLGEETALFLHKQLLTVRGWAGHVQYQTRERALRGGQDASMLGLLAVRLSYGAALLRQYDGPAVRARLPAGKAVAPAAAPFEVAIRHVWQLAHEHAWSRRLADELRSARAVEPLRRKEKSVAQVVFCIDVRSEVFRRALEGLSSRVETRGFAGFFGLPLEYLRSGEQDANAQCPVLLTPKFRVHQKEPASARGRAQAGSRREFRRRLKQGWHAFKVSAVSGFSFVEAAGLAFATRLLHDEFHHLAAPPPPPPRPRGRGPGRTSMGKPRLVESRRPTESNLLSTCCVTSA